MDIICKAYATALWSLIFSGVFFLGVAMYSVEAHGFELFGETEQNSFEKSMYGSYPSSNWTGGNIYKELEKQRMENRVRELERNINDIQTFGNRGMYTIY